MDEIVYTLDDLASLTGISKRTIRYYIQMGLVDRPIGETKASRYTPKHLERLLTVQRLTAEGLTLEGVKKFLEKDGESKKIGCGPKPGTITAMSKIAIAPGIDLVVSHGESGKSADELRELVKKIMEAIGAADAVPLE